MLDQIILYSLRNKLIILLLTAGIIGAGLYSLTQLPIGAVPDVTNNQVQVITTSRNLATQDVEQFLTYPVELEMANLPGVKEIRSVSKFGLSVVTIVFNDNMGTYLPRQLISEKIKSAEERIPKGFGTPFQGPVTTGLGEVYQYTLEVKPEFQHKYSITDLRTIQDWVVKRQLSGIQGVVEVNTWGGYLKQYEVAVNPEELRAMGVSLGEVFDALENSNKVAGGGYIERLDQAFFIRGEGLVKGLEDIENILVTHRDGLPVLIRDIGEVKYGHATRFGAITGNGEGEKVMGQIMMLKDANSRAVIDAIKQRVTEISDKLPEGVYINPFLERSELVGKTTFTIAENLILGTLIVVFVVILLLGNIRSGLVVASIIPLCLLFALTLMHIFGVDANLMSLGAIDFGIIIDGAVIIVEFTAFSITRQSSNLRNLTRREQQAERDKLTQQGASKMMRSAIFGQLIIMIVFIPILSLANVEGKMFRPMALVFIFALLGAMFLCLTYVPVVSSLFLRPFKENKKSITMRLMNFIHKLYEPTLKWALRMKWSVLGGAIALLVAAVFLFTRMGGEFIPTLDEGDFVIQPGLKTGTSLGRTIEITTQIEQILGKFPEVEQAVSRIGAAEVPTDPMSMEESDVIIKLKPKSEWVNTTDKDELAELFKEALSVLPGVEVEFTQPIEMRFNELITGVRGDLAVKVFGENLDVLAQKANEIKNAIADIPGASDVTVEKIVGLPQMSVQYNHAKLARHGLNAGDVNEVIQLAFAGIPAGTVFEGEKQFDLVVRYDSAHRQAIENLREATVELPTGGTIPLRELAQVEYTTGPARISRDNTRRRIVVSVNVRGRDLESVVQDVQKRIKERVTFPEGYFVTYGGQFENLRTARERLMIAVPIALVLIFVLLYFAFHSVKDALMIYSAIPLASVGGVILLYLRDMPFSISAGVGFIALFGIAVLNGIVLIEHFKELKEHGVADLRERILKGTRDRLRPVLLTASAAALGFLPMAISTNAGAEVQRPLATVVIGGLISATLLTLIVLPVLYAFFEGGKKKKKSEIMEIHETEPVVEGIESEEKVEFSAVEKVWKKGWGWKPALGILLSLAALSANAQGLTLMEAQQIALRNDLGLQAKSQEIEKSRVLQKSAADIEQTQFYYGFDQNNIAENGLPISVVGATQSVRFPTVYGAQRRVLESDTRMTEVELALAQRDVLNGVSQTWLEAQYWQQVANQMAWMDSLYTDFAKASARRFELGESNYLEKLTAEGKQKEMQLRREQAQKSHREALHRLKGWLQTPELPMISAGTPSKLALAAQDTAGHPAMRWFAEAQQQQAAQVRAEQQSLLPDLHLSLFAGTNRGPDAQVYKGIQAGVGVPIAFGAQRSKIQAAQIQGEILQKQAENFERHQEAALESLAEALAKYDAALQWYEGSGKTLVDELRRTATRAWQTGEIDYFSYVQSLETARAMELNWLENLWHYNQTILEIKYFTWR